MKCRNLEVCAFYTKTFITDSFVAGDIGGNMGLFLGCSLLTLFEFVDLLWNFIESRANRVKSKSQGERSPGEV